MIDYRRYIECFRESGLFEGISEDKYKNVLSCLDAKIADYNTGNSLVTEGDTNYLAGIVLSGGLEEFIYDENSTPVIIRRLAPGDIFGAELACSRSLASQFSLEATENSSVLLLDFGSLMSTNTLTCPCRMQVTANLLQELASQVNLFNVKVRILSQKKLRDKIKVFLQTQKMDENGIIELPFTRNKMAEFLYVDRSALSRELSRMRDENIILVNGMQITMVDKNFLK